eukprot:gene48208-64682_t
MSALSSTHEPPQLELIAPSPAQATVDGSIELAGSPLPVRFYGRRPSRGTAPLVLHLHGGQFVSGGLDSGRCMGTLLAQAGAVVVSVAYPLAPEHPFPQGLEAAWALGAPDPANGAGVEASDTLEAFLRAATFLVNEQGYRGASVDKISARLKVTKGSFYHHHDTKQDLIAACFARSLAVQRQAFQLAVASAGSGWER